MTIFTTNPNPSFQVKYPSTTVSNAKPKVRKQQIINNKKPINNSIWFNNRKSIPQQDIKLAAMTHEAPRHIDRWGPSDSLPIGNSSRNKVQVLIILGNTKYLKVIIEILV